MIDGEIVFKTGGISVTFGFMVKDSDFNRILDIPINILEAFCLENFKHRGISESNVRDFINSEDPKYKLEDFAKEILTKYIYGEEAN